MVVDKFTKWIKAKPMASVMATKAVEFVREIVNQFGVPNEIITNNEIHFTAREFKDFCEDLGIKIQYASVTHPKSNGQVKRSNGLIL